MASFTKFTIYIAVVIAGAFIVTVLLGGCANNAPNAYQSAAMQYRACLQNSPTVEACERQEKTYRFERDQATIRQNDAVAGSARQQQTLNSLAIYNAMSSPCGIGTPCRRY